MAQIQVNQLSFHYYTHGEDIFKNVNLSLDTKWKIGLIGRNGRGKTTFLKLLLGDYQYEGKINATVKFEYFPVKVKCETLLAKTVVREAIAPFDLWESEMESALEAPIDVEKYGDFQEKYENNDGYTINEQIEKEMNLMGLELQMLERPFSSLSGGEQTKLLLIALFLKKNHFLLLDEPTDHLDIEGRQMVADYLKQKTGFIVISHDRLFLNQVIDHVMSINRNDIIIEKGNYETWALNKKRQDEYELAKREQLKSEITRLSKSAVNTSGWANQVEGSKKGSGPVDRGYIGAKSAKMMKRAKVIKNRVEKSIEEKSQLLKNIEQSSDLILRPEDTRKNDLIQVDNFQLFYGEKAVFKPIQFKLKKGDRLWIKGENGCGKSTLLKFLSGQEIKFKGRYDLCHNFSYVSQMTGHLKGNLNDYIRQIGGEDALIKTTLHELGLSNQQFDKPIHWWSEGQKKKLLLAVSICQKAPLYIWDEPLNFIDIISRDQLERMILKFQPTLIFVEHDEWFGKTIATHELKLEANDE